MMGRPKSKSELVEVCDKNYHKLIAFINDLSEEKRNSLFPETYMNRNISDVLCHLHHWHLLFFNWYEIGMNGKKPAMPAEGYTWKDNPALNKHIWEKYQGTALPKALKKLNSSHQNMLSIIDAHTNEELFEKKRYKWTGSTSMGAYMISASSSHYDWAYKLIKKCLT